jgi:hypothetical protein
VRRGVLHCAYELLAVNVQPDDQRRHAGLRLLQRRVLGRLAGVADAPRGRQRVRDPDGLLHASVVCERRLHRKRFNGSTIVNGSQQQWLVRNSSIDGWTNGVWNQVFSGVVGGPGQCFPAQAACGGRYTTIATSPVTREAPYLYVDASGNENILVPSAQTNSAGTTWAGRTDARRLDPDRPVLRREAG